MVSVNWVESVKSIESNDMFCLELMESIIEEYLGRAILTALR